MQQTYGAVVKQDGDWWIGWIEELPGINAQERTREELVASLRVALAETQEFDRTLEPLSRRGSDSWDAPEKASISTSCSKH